MSVERGLRIRLAAPLHWRPCSEAEAEAAAARAENVLQLLNLLAEGQGSHEAPEAERAACRHLERKLDVIVAMLGLLLEDTGTGERAALPVEIDPEGLRWEGEEGPEPGSRVIVCLDLPGAPPLCLPGTAAASDPPSRAVSFGSLPAPLADALARWIFVRHRQAVARARANP